MYLVCRPGSLTEILTRPGQRVGSSEALMTLASFKELHLLIQVPGLIRYQFRWRPVIGLRTPGVQRVLILLWPRVLTMASIQAYFVARDSLHFDIIQTLVATVIAAVIVIVFAFVVARTRLA